MDPFGAPYCETKVMDPTGEKAQTPRSLQRRRQVLDAAAICFRQYGFHGASIAQISKAAGMSAGHIYHFFESKEAIIAALVEDQLDSSVERIARIDAEHDVLRGMLDSIQVTFAEKTDPEYVGLWLEVLAEAARNPSIAKVVQAADQEIRQRVTRLGQSARTSGGIDSSVKPEAVTEVAMALFEGVINRSIQNPDMDKEEVLKVLRIAARAILEA